MARLLYNNEGGLLGADPGSGGTTITFATAPNFATITGSDYIPLVLDAGLPTLEIVWLTAYTAAATTGTITRAAEDSSHWPAVAHPGPGTWVCAPTVNDISYPQNCPAGRIYSGTTQSMNTGTPAGLIFSASSFLRGGMTATGLGTGAAALVAPVTGLYQIEGSVTVAGSSGILVVNIAVAGSVITNAQVPLSASYSQPVTSDLVLVTAGQAITLQATQTSGTSQSTFVSSAIYQYLSAALVSTP